MSPPGLKIHPHKCNITFHTAGCHPAVKSGKALTFARTWTGHEHTTLSERCRMHKATWCDPIYVTCPKQAHPWGKEVGE